MIESEKRLKRWRMMLGGDANDGIGISLNSSEAAVDRAVSQLYEGALVNRPQRQGGTGSSNPNIATWLGDIRTYFPASVVKVMQQDALDRFNLRQLLLEPELLSETVADVHLVATLIALKNLIPERTKSTAREVVGKLVRELMQRLENPMRQAVLGAVNRASRNSRPRHNEIDWHRTIRANLKHYQAEFKTIIPEKRIGYSRRQASLRDVILVLDQSGSMAESVVYAGIFAAVLASLPAISTRVVAFDTSVVDLTNDLHDPIELLFGVQLGGGTDINKALAYCQGLVQRPQETILVLISDLYDGGDKTSTVRRAAALTRAGVQVIALLALSDSGTPAYEHGLAQNFTSLGIPSFACTPDLFPELIAAAISKRDIGQWAANLDILKTD